MTEIASVPGRSLYKYVDLKGLSRILDGSIRFTQPSAFNDPFELLPEVVSPLSQANQLLRIAFDITAKRRQHSLPASADEQDGLVSTDALSRDVVHQLNALIGIFCLSKRADSLLMWAHYADSYAGAVIEFDGSHEVFSNPIEVDYHRIRPKISVDFYRNPREPIPVAELCVKSDQWAYEQEVRVIRPLSECRKIGTDARQFPVYVKDIPATCIKSVILGERTPVSEQRNLYARLRESNIGLSISAIDHAGFNFRTEIVKLRGPHAGPWLSPRTAHIFSDRPTQLGDLARSLIEHHPLSGLVNKPV